MNTQVSPNFADDKLTNPSLDDLIDVFEDRVRCCMLEPAKMLLDVAGGIPAVCLLMTYFEGYAIYRDGMDSVGKSKAFFRQAFLDIFAHTGLPEDLLARVAELLYEDARCGFFHDGFFRSRVLFSTRGQGALEVTVPRVDGKPDQNGDIQSVLINPRQLCATIEGRFAEYVRLLRDPRQVRLRANFKKAVDMKWRLALPGPIVGVGEQEFERRRG